MRDQHLVGTFSHGVEAVLTRFGHVEDRIFLNVKNKIAKAAQRQAIDIALLQLRLIGNRGPERLQSVKALAQRDRLRLADRHAEPFRQFWPDVAPAKDVAVGDIECARSDSSNMMIP